MTDETLIIDVSAAKPQGSPELPLHILAVRRPRKVYGGMWGLPEIVAAGVGAVALAAAILLYMFVVVPSNRELANNRSEAERLDAELTSAKKNYGDITSTEEQVGKLLRSVDDFETRFLPLRSIGQAALFQRLNSLIAANYLTNTTGPDYAPLETADQKNANQTDEERGREKFRSLFPGVYVSITLEGSYVNLRRFIREIETGNEFLVISSVEIEPSDTEQKKPANGALQQTASNPAGGIPLGETTGTIADMSRGGQPAAQPQIGPPAAKGKTHGETVALRIEMAAYFRRANYSPMTAPAAAK